MMRVLLLSDYPPRWEFAPASRLLYLAGEIAREGHEVRVLGARTDRPAAMPGVDVVVASRARGGGVRQALFPWAREVRHSVCRAEALVVRGYWLAFWVFLSAVFRGKAMRVYDFHGFVWKEQLFCGRKARSVTTRVLESFGLALATHVMCVSAGVRDELPARAREKAFVLENGVQVDAPGPGSVDAAGIARLRERLGLTPDLPVFAIIGHLGPWVNIGEAVRAASRLAGSAELVIIGDGPSVTVAEAEKAAISAANVRLVGRLSHEDMVLFLRHLCLACISPYSDSWVCSQKPNFFASRKVKEYLAAGRPVIVSDVRGRGDFLVNGETCLVYPAGDSEALAGRMKALLADGRLAARLGQNSRELAGQFGWAKLYHESRLPSLFGASSDGRP